MAFNPDAYLAKKSSDGGGFNPDAYLAKKSGPEYGQAQTALEHGANAMALGYLPQLQAAAQKPIFSVLNTLTGQDVEPDSYVEARDANIQRLAAEEKQNPKTALASQVGGGLVGGLAMPIPGGAAKGLVGALGKGAAMGAGYGLLQNPGDVEGKVDPIQLNERLNNAKSGAMIGGIAGGVTHGVSKGLEKLANSDKSLNKFAREKAVKASGAMLKDFRQLAGKDAIDDVGKFALDKKLVQAGDTWETIGQKAEALNENAGSRLEQLYKRAKEAIPSALEGSSAELEGLSDKEFRKLARTGFNPLRDKKSILSAAKKELDDEVGGKAALQSLSNYLDDLSERLGDKTLDPKRANDIKSAIDRRINYARNPMSKEPDVESAFKIARRFISGKIDEHISFLGKFMKDEKALAALKEANKDYGYSKQISQMARDRLQRENANRMFGLTDTIAGSAGGAAGAVAGSLLGHDKQDAFELSALGALAGGVGNKLARTYGNAALASGANKLGTAAKYTVVPMGRAASATINPQALSRGLIEAGLLREAKKKKK